VEARASAPRLTCLLLEHSRIKQPKLDIVAVNQAFGSLNGGFMAFACERLRRTANMAGFVKLVDSVVGHQCAVAVVLAADMQKRELFARLAEHLGFLASEVERALAAKRAGGDRHTSAIAPITITVLGKPSKNPGPPASTGLTETVGGLKVRRTTDEAIAAGEERRRQGGVRPSLRNGIGAPPDRRPVATKWPSDSVTPARGS
jgi:hypothetical protein